MGHIDPHQFELTTGLYLLIWIVVGGYATFLGYSLVNDDPTTGRFGLIQAVAGGYSYKG